MRTLNSYAYEILELLQKNLGDDFEIDIRLIKELIIEQRKLSIANLISRGGSADYGSSSGYDGGWDIFTQTQTFALTRETLITSGSICYENRESWKSTTTVPRIMTMGRRLAVTNVSITYPDLYTIKPSILFTSKDRGLYSGSGRFNSTQLVSFIKNQYLYVVGKVVTPTRTIASVIIEAIFDDPRDVSEFDDDTSELAMGKLWPYIQDYVWKTAANKINAPEDKTNNATNE
jgi:hypothetical protein